MGDLGQEVNVLTLRVHRNQFLVEVGLDAWVQFQVHVGFLSRQLDAHDNFTTLVDSQLANLGGLLCIGVVA